MKRKAPVLDDALSAAKSPAASHAEGHVFEAMGHAARDAADRVSSSLKVAARPLVRAVDSAEDGIDSVVDYVTHIEPRRAIRKASVTIKHHPLKAVGLSLGLGFFLGQLLRIAPSRRREA
ncbi:MAG: hypothetical protein NTZ90_18385 [Proteobacteria bacterium]|nr:hypothetical protein [Pseudomonadota bacterium]